MKNAVKGVVGQELTHKANEDTFPSNHSQTSKDTYSQFPTMIFEPSEEYHISEEDDFRRLLRSSYQPTKAPSHLLQKIKQSIRQPEQE